MSFIGAAATVLGTTGAVGIGTTMLAGAMMGGATTIGMNLIRGNDPFDNIGQGLLMGGIGGGIFGGAGAAAGNAANATAATELAAIEAAAGPSTMVANTGNIASDVAFNNAVAPAGTLNPVQTYGLADPNAGLTVTPLQSQTFASQPFVPDTVSEMANFDTGRNFHQTNNGLNAAPGNYEGGYFPTTSEQIARANNYEVMSTDAFKPINAPTTPTGSPLNKPVSAASPEFLKDPFGYLTHKDNRLQAAGVALGGLKLAGAFDPKTGLNNLPPRTYQRVNTSYNPGTVNPNYGQPGQPYFVGQGYGPQTRETYNAAAGGGIRALSGGGETYVPMTPTGGMRRGEKFPSGSGPDAYPTFVEYLKSNINKDEEKGQAEIDKTVMAWLERHAKSDIKGMAEGGLSNLPAAYQQPQYQMSDFANSPMFQPTGGNAPVQPGISEYIASLNQRSYAPPAPAAAPTSVNTTAATVYNPATQTYSTNPNLAVPVPVVEDSQDGYFGGEYNDKAGGPIKAKKYAMGGLAALPEYAAGGQLLSGDGDGMSDSIPAVIKGERPQRAALADGEFVIPADVVSHLGNGSTKAGGKRLYEMMATIRKARTGNSKQGKQINPMKFMPA